MRVSIIPNPRANYLYDFCRNTYRVYLKDIYFISYYYCFLTLKITKILLNSNIFPTTFEKDKSEQFPKIIKTPAYIKTCVQDSETFGLKKYNNFVAFSPFPVAAIGFPPIIGAVLLGSRTATLRSESKSS